MPDFRNYQNSTFVVSEGGIYHFGKGHDDNPPGRGSGRYPYGSGKRPFQGDINTAKDIAKSRNVGIIQYSQKAINSYFKNGWATEKNIIPKNVLEDLESERVIKKGSKLYRFTNNENENPNNPTYVFMSRHDFLEYAGSEYFKKSKYIAEYVAEKDIKLPSIETLTNVMLDTAFENDKIFNKVSREVAERAGSQYITSKIFGLDEITPYESYNTDKNKVNITKKILYETPNLGLMMWMYSRFGVDGVPNFIKNFDDRLKEMGYDGYPDLHNVDMLSGGYTTHTATYLFNKNSLKNISVDTVNEFAQRTNNRGVEDSYTIERLKRRDKE